MGVFSNQGLLQIKIRYANGCLKLTIVNKNNRGGSTLTMKLQK